MPIKKHRDGTLLIIIIILIVAALLKKIWRRQTTRQVGGNKLAVNITSHKNQTFHLRCPQHGSTDFFLKSQISTKKPQIFVAKYDKHYTTFSIPT